MRHKVTFIDEYKHTKYLFEVEKNVFSHPFSRMPFALNFSHNATALLLQFIPKSTSGEWTPAFTFVFKQPLIIPLFKITIIPFAWFSWWLIVF